MNDLLLQQREAGGQDRGEGEEHAAEAGISAKTTTNVPPATARHRNGHRSAMLIVQFPNARSTTTDLFDPSSGRGRAGLSDGAAGSLVLQLLVACMFDLRDDVIPIRGPHQLIQLEVTRLLLAALSMLADEHLYRRH